LFAFNDVSAIGAIRALRDAGMQVPQDVAVVGFDDIPIAAYNTPSLTTIRQPLRRMGEIAARTLLDRIRNGTGSPTEVAVEPELIVRESTRPQDTSSADAQKQMVQSVQSRGSE
jgi:DNA-binding LacI/PurR family transcriptional regulator